MFLDKLFPQVMFNADTGGEGGTGGSGGGEDWIDSYYNNKDTNNNSTNNSTNNNTNTNNDNMIPKSRFDEVNSKYKELSDLSKTKQAEYDEIIKNMDEVNSSKKELEDTLKAGTERIEALEGLIKGMLDAELESIDEEYHDLIPKDKPIEEQLDWLRKAQAKGVFGNKGFDFEIGQPSNPRNSKSNGSTDGMSTIQMLTMGYGTK